MSDAPTLHDLIIIGSTGGGLSVAVDAQRAGLSLVRVITEGSTVAFPELINERGLDVGYGESVLSIDLDIDSGTSKPTVIVSSSKQSYHTKACLVATRSARPNPAPSIPITTVSDAAADRIHINTAPEGVSNLDVLVVGASDHAVEMTASLAASGARVVLSGGGIEPSLLSPAGDAILRRLERDRRATVLYRSTPDQIGETDGFPMAFFDDRRVPDLQFDHVVFAIGRLAPTPESVGLTTQARTSGAVWFFGGADELSTENQDLQFSPGWDIWARMSASSFPDLPRLAHIAPADRRRRHTGAIEELRTEHYNATITHFEPSHSDLWVLRVRPDTGDTAHLPGQYASLGLGFWEPRIDDAEDHALGERWEKLIRRSYSISSRMFDSFGYLTDDSRAGELEFYIVLVPPTEDNVPALTPRLALKRPGDRIYLGAKVAGRYTTADLTDPDATLLFLSTGTGEAPQNAMVVEMLRRGHVGPIVSAVSVRQWADLGYREKHERLAKRAPNYHYLPVPTREPEVPKRYLQDLLRDRTLEEELGIELDPQTTHVFLCGNPAMIGLPEEVDGVLKYPETVGVVQLLEERGFTLDRRKQRGNIHYEEYW